MNRISMLLQYTVSHFRLGFILQTDLMHSIALTDINAIASVYHCVLIDEKPSDLRPNRDIKLFCHLAQNIYHRY
jgi:hypothetical protein